MLVIIGPGNIEGLNTLALTTVVCVISIGFEYNVELRVGFEPSRVYLISPPKSVKSVTDWLELYKPPHKLNMGSFKAKSLKNGVVLSVFGVAFAK